MTGSDANDDGKSKPDGGAMSGTSGEPGGSTATEESKSRTANQDRVASSLCVAEDIENEDIKKGTRWVSDACLEEKTTEEVLNAVVDGCHETADSGIVLHIASHGAEHGAERRTRTSEDADGSRRVEDDAPSLTRALDGSVDDDLRGWRPVSNGFSQGRPGSPGWSPGPMSAGIMSPGQSGGQDVLVDAIAFAYQRTAES